MAIWDSCLRWHCVAGLLVAMSSTISCWGGSNVGGDQVGDEDCIETWKCYCGLYSSTSGTWTYYYISDEFSCGVTSSDVAAAIEEEVKKESHYPVSCSAEACEKQE